MRAQDQEPAGTSRSQPRRAPTRATGPAPIPLHPAAPLTPQAILHLQRTLGNAAVARLIEAQRQQSHSGGDDGEHNQPVQRSAVHDVLRSPGRPLDDDTRTEMESRLGADFGDVRVHTDTTAQRSAEAIGARAYTSGNHVVIGAGGGDAHTLAHELTHVVQQRSGPVSGTDVGGLKVSDPADRFEREAEVTAHRVMYGPVPETPVARSAEAPATGNAVQRMYMTRGRGTMIVPNPSTPASRAGNPFLQQVYNDHRQERNGLRNPWNSNFAAIKYEVHRSGQWVPGGIESGFNHSDNEHGSHGEEVVIEALNAKCGPSNWRPVEIWTDNSPCGRCKAQLSIIVQRCAGMVVFVRHAATWGPLAQDRHPLIRKWWQ